MNTQSLCGFIISRLSAFSIYESDNTDSVQPLKDNKKEVYHTFMCQF